MTTLTDRFSRAVDYARIAHERQLRKGTYVPYLSHVLGVAALVIEFGGSEEQAIAGLLHDTIEDCGQAHEGMIRALFGEAVVDIVIACTDVSAEARAADADPAVARRNWYVRKRAHLANTIDADDSVLLVSACEKLHNARAIVQDLENPAIGQSVFDRFNGGREGTLGYYQSLAHVFATRNVVLAAEFDNAVGRMHDLAGRSPRTPLRSAEELERWRAL
ncbi:MAG: HD domain-containing protein, partial [Luteimonas sp.]|nr:HD domain-containing protein [Luteimonas sp.]